VSFLALGDYRAENVASNNIRAFGISGIRDSGIRDSGGGFAKPYRADQRHYQLIWKIELQNQNIGISTL
jgi:hypothetical protein